MLGLEVKGDLAVLDQDGTARNRLVDVLPIAWSGLPGGFDLVANLESTYRRSFGVSHHHAAIGYGYLLECLVHYSALSINGY